ncbi:MAG: hypothetical protein HY394_01825 [Candidatus Diapherotrites archaeon]|nr:hypothetical protein [Candidatus Diapherotrites archaeon]
MAEKLDIKSGAVAGGLTGVALSIICAAAIYAFPGAAMGLFTSMIHSNIPIEPRPFEAAGFLSGLVMAFIIGAIVVGIFVPIYNALAKR